MLAGDGQLVARARTLRKAMSLPEVLLWKALRQRPAGLKFRRQHPAGSYVVDFYCHEARMLVEVDGSSHDVRAERDDERDSYFAERHIATLRIPARAVLGDIEGVVATIVREARRETPLRPFGPPPLAGEDLE